MRRTFDALSYNTSNPFPDRTDRMDQADVTHIDSSGGSIRHCNATDSTDCPGSMILHAGRRDFFY